MFTYFNRQKEHILFSAISRVVVCVLSLSLIFAPSAAYAQSINLLNLPAPGTMVLTSPAFNPVIVTGIKIYPDNPLQFDFIIDIGDDQLQGEALKKESQRLINYFMATLTVPEDEMWVNLSPYEKDRIIAEGLSHTEMGRDMLAQDYLLKQLTASLMYPEDDFGKKFWNRVYSKAQAEYGTTEIPMNTFNKIWIVPDEAVVYVHDTNVFVVENHLKVMLEEDYLALESNVGSTKHGLGNITKNDIEVVSGVSAEIIREVLLPEIEKEVNEGKNFANLRQMYNSMLLATWYKKNLKESLLGKIYADKNKTNGIELEDKEIKQKIYDRYVEAFEKGVYNYIKEDIDSATQEVIPRKYFSGGLEGYTSEDNSNSFKETTGNVPSILVDKAGRPHVVVRVSGETLGNGKRWSSPVSVNAEILTKLKSKTIDIVKEIARNGSADIRPVIDLARQTYAGFDPKIPEDRWPTVTPEEFIILNTALKYQVYLPNNNLFEIVRISEGEEFIVGEIVQDSWTEHDYLRGKIWVGESVPGDGGYNVGGMSPGWFAIFHTDSLREAGRRRYKELKQATFSQTGLYTRPYEAVMISIMQMTGVSEEDFVEGIAVEHVRQEEIKHAQDSSYVAQKLRSDIRMEPNEDERIVSEIVKSDSTLQQKVLVGLEQQAEGDGLTAKLNRQIGLRTITEYSGQLGGAIAEIKNHLGANREELAFIAFLHFMEDQFLSTTPQEMPTDDVIALAHINVAVLLFQDMDEWAGYRLDYSSIDVIRMLGMEPGKLPVQKALRMLEEIYAKHFYTDEERLERITGDFKMANPSFDGEGSSSLISNDDLDVDVSTQPLVQFYAGTRGDHRDRKIEDMWGFSHETLEDEHDLIQMMFPSNKMGMFFQMNVMGVDESRVVWPQLVTGDVEIWKGDTNTGRLLRANMLHSLETMLNFYGFRFNLDNPDEVTIERGENFEERRQNWLNEGNHNFLRIDRILNSMKFVGLEKYSLAFFDALSEVHNEYGDVIDAADSFTFWKNSVGSIETTDKLTVAEHESNISASSPVQQSLEYGGIDFNPNNINLSEQGDKVQINFSSSPLQNLDPESINGILPVIINISPLPSVLPLLGLEPRKKDDYIEVSRLN